MRALCAINLILTCFLFAISVTILGLIGHLLAYSNGKYAANTVAVFSRIASTSGIDGQSRGAEVIQNTFALLPQNLDGGSYWIIFAAGMGGVLDALLIAFFMFRLKPIIIRFLGGKVYTFRAFPFVVTFLALLRVVIGTAAVIFSHIQFYGSSTFDINAVPVVGRQYPPQGHFTLGAFNCQIQRYAEGEEVARGLNKLCLESQRSARWLLIPYVVISGCITVLNLVIIRMGDGKPKVEDDQEFRTIASVGTQ